MSTDQNKHSVKFVESDIVTDVVINNLYNDFFYFYFLKYKKIHISRTRNYRERKEKHPQEWNTFIKLSKLCFDNQFDSYKFVRYVFNISNSQISIKDMLNIKFIRMYSEFQSLERKYEKITTYLEKSFKNVNEICLNNKLHSLTDFLKYMLKNHQLMSYMKAGYVSKYFIVLIPGVKSIRKYFTEEEKTEFDTFIGKVFDVIQNNAVNACNFTHKEHLLKVSEIFENKSLTN